MTAAAAQIRRGRKFDQVLEGAREVFLTLGFEGASVDDIARAAGVSKATLYSYFPDKRVLFMEMARAQCEQQTDEALQMLDMNDPPQVVLGKAGRKFLTFVLSDLGQRMFRTCLAESERFPEIGRNFYESGPMVMRAVMTDYFQKCCDRGELRIADLNLAADQFAELCKADLWLQTMFGIRQDVSEAEIARIVDQAVKTFMARYGT